MKFLTILTTIVFSLFMLSSCSRDVGGAKADYNALLGSCEVYTGFNHALYQALDTHNLFAGNSVDDNDKQISIFLSRRMQIELSFLPVYYSQLTKSIAVLSRPDSLLLSRYLASTHEKYPKNFALAHAEIGPFCRDFMHKLEYEALLGNDFEAWIRLVQEGGAD